MKIEKQVLLINLFKTLAFAKIIEIVLAGFGQNK